MAKAPRDPIVHPHTNKGDMFALVVHASASADQDNYPEGQRHTLLVIVRAQDPEEALTTAVVSASSGSSARTMTSSVWRWPSG